MKQITITFFVLIFMAVGMLVLSAAPGVSADTVAKMSKEELKGLLDSGSDVIIIDVRRGRDWTSSEFKIKGAERADPADFEKRADNYPKDKTLVLYCA